MKRNKEDIDPIEEQEMTQEPDEEGYPVDEEEQGQAEEQGQTHPSLKEVIKEKAREDEQPFSSTFSLRTILGGDILNTQAIRKQIWLFLLITIFAVLYISNRYSCQKQQIEIDRLTKELKTSKYKTLSLSSILTERCRESHVVEMLRANNDSTIHPADQPPYIIMTPR
ncbi:MAG: hypothetical protein J5637_04990 [Prevotella sp.]|nr:hypothetical protein [Prevotella sp.]